MNQVLLFAALLIAFLYLGSSFLVPFVFGIFFAILMAPLSRYLENKLGFNRIFSSLTSTLVVFLAAGSILFLFVYQINMFVSDISSSQEEIQSFIKNIQERIASATNFSVEEQEKFWEKRSKGFIETAQPYITGLFGSIFSTLGNFLIMLIYVFLLLLYRHKITEFAMMYTKREKKGEIKEILHKTGLVVFQYLFGRIKVMAILAVLYIITFLIFDLPYAILLTIFGALITVVPYIGPLVSGILPVLFAAIFFNDMQKTLIFAAIVLTIQLVESYVLEPLIMGKQVNLNPLVIIVAIIIGGMVWGLAGMILFVPIFAMFRIISDHTSGLEPVGFLVSDTEEEKD